MREHAPSAMKSASRSVIVTASSTASTGTVVQLSAGATSASSHVWRAGIAAPFGQAVTSWNDGAQRGASGDGDERRLAGRHRRRRRGGGRRGRQHRGAHVAAVVVAGSDERRPAPPAATRPRRTAGRPSCMRASLVMGLRKQSGRARTWLDIVTSMADGRTILTVHAHPDDEASKGAPTLAKYHAQGVRTVLVCCTGGEEGELQNPTLREPGPTVPRADARGGEGARRQHAPGRARGVGGGDRVRRGRDARLPRLGHGRIGGQQQSRRASARPTSTRRPAGWWRSSGAPARR